MDFFRLQPSRPGDAWSHSIFDASRKPLRLIFSYVLSSGDPIFADHPFLFVTRSFGGILRSENLTGYSLEPVETMTEPQFRGLSPEPVEQLNVLGRAGADDFGLVGGTNLVISERVLDLLRRANMKDAAVFDYDPNYRTPSPEEFLKSFKKKRE